MGEELSFVLCSSFLLFRSIVHLGILWQPDELEPERSRRTMCLGHEYNEVCRRGFINC